MLAFYRYHIKYGEKCELTIDGEEGYAIWIGRHRLFFFFLLSFFFITSFAFLEDHNGLKYTLRGRGLLIEQTQVRFIHEDLLHPLCEGIQMFWPYGNEPNKYAIHIQMKVHYYPNLPPDGTNVVYGTFYVSFGSANRHR